MLIYDAVNPFYIDYIKQLFKNLECKILSSNDGHDAYQAFLKHQPDLVILISGGMGNDEGYDALEVAKGLGADVCFHKPIEPEALVDSVSTFPSS